MSGYLSNNLKDYLFHGIIGSGAFSIYYKVSDKINRNFSVWEVIDYGWMFSSDREMLISEVKQLMSINHDNIVRIYSHMNNKTTSNLYIQMEYFSFGTLRDLINKQAESKKLFEENFIWEILEKLLKVLKWLNSKLPNLTMICYNVIASNVFIDKSLNIKLGGFKLNENLYYKYEMPIEILSSSNLSYISPEVLSKERHTQKAIVWALGCLIHEVACLALPFSGSNASNLLTNIKSGIRKHIPECFSQNLQIVIDLLLEPNPFIRPFLEDIQLHKPENHLILNGIRKLSIGNGYKKKEKHNLTLKHDIIKHQDYCDHIDLVGRLNSLEQKEQALKRKEWQLRDRERSLVKRERKIAFLEKLSHIQFKTFDKNRSRKSRTEYDTSLSGDAGDTSLPVTSEKLNLENIERPRFLLKDVTNHKIVRFEVDCENTTENDRVEKKEILNIPNTHYFNSSDYLVPKSKKNIRKIKNKEIKESRILLSKNNKQTKNFLETHFL